ncbi:hypothetical protein BGP_6028 [Beggiatoa sp. PS]|nr:hypothetical protein BGP_6028 [Beggiatoa sp. PS]
MLAHIFSGLPVQFCGYFPYISEHHISEHHIGLLQPIFSELFLFLLVKGLLSLFIQNKFWTPKSKALALVF